MDLRGTDDGAVALDRELHFRVFFIAVQRIPHGLTQIINAGLPALGNGGFFAANGNGEIQHVITAFYLASDHDHVRPPILGHGHYFFIPAFSSRATPVAAPASGSRPPRL